MAHDGVCCKAYASSATRYNSKQTDMGLSGIDNSTVSKSVWPNRIQVLNKLHLGSPRTGICHLSHFVATHSANVLLARKSLLLIDCVCSDIEQANLLACASFATKHGVYRLMCIITKIYDISRLYRLITEPTARSALFRHAHRCNTALDTMLVRAHDIDSYTTVSQQCLTQHDLLTSRATYNNTSEIELEGNDMQTPEEPASSLYPVGTKVAKQFDGVDGELFWFEGVVQRYDEEDDLYWVLSNDGDSKDMNEPEVRDAVHDYRVHLQHDVVVAEAQIDTCDSSVPNISVDANDTNPLTRCERASTCHSHTSSVAKICHAT
eukprot:15059-Heterococcus_DN1.PRE.5